MEFYTYTLWLDLDFGSVSHKVVPQSQMYSLCMSSHTLELMHIRSVVTTQSFQFPQHVMILPALWTWRPCFGNSSLWFKAVVLDLRTNYPSECWGWDRQSRSQSASFSPQRAKNGYKKCGNQVTGDKRRDCLIATTIDLVNRVRQTLQWHLGGSGVVGGRGSLLRVVEKAQMGGRVGVSIYFLVIEASPVVFVRLELGWGCREGRRRDRESWQVAKR